MEDAAVTAQPGAFASFFGPDPFNLLCVVILTSLGTWGLPQMIHKFYAIRDERSIKTGTVISTLFALIVAGGCYFLGGFGRLFQGQVDLTQGYDTIIPTMLQSLPDVLIGVVVILVLSASMSTLASLVLSSSSTLTLDFIRGNIAKKMKESHLLIIMRVLVVVFIAISVAIALLQYYSSVTFIAQLMGISWGALAGSFLGPFLYGLYWKRTTKAACFASFFTGVGITVSNLFLGYLSSPINAGALAIVASLVIVPVVSLLTPKPKKQQIDAIFQCYEEREVHSTLVLDDEE